MPYFDRFAYTDKRCYDMDAADVGDLMPTRSSTTLQSDEIDALADYVAGKIKVLPLQGLLKTSCGFRAYGDSVLGVGVDVQALQEPGHVDDLGVIRVAAVKDVQRRYLLVGQGLAQHNRPDP